MSRNKLLLNKNCYDEDSKDVRWCRMFAGTILGVPIIWTIVFVYRGYIRVI